MKEIDIASFAESMLTERIDSGKPVQFAAQEAPNAPDVSEVKVPEDFTSQILTEGHWAKAEIDVKVKPQRPQRPQRQQVEKPSQSSELSEEVQIRKELFEDYRSKLKELDDIVKEMTTVGMLGVGPGAVSAPGMSVSRKKKKKKNARTSRFNR
jgi:hypothetical protein